MRWSSHFPEPIALKDGRIIETLGEAGALILRLQKLRQADPVWVYATELLMKAAESGIASDIDLANIQMWRALRTEGYV